MRVPEFPISERSRIEHGGSLPSQADVVVIGGGVIGVCTALFLARKGVSVVLVEKGRIAGEQSSRNWGWIRQQGRDPHELPIMMEAARHWRDFDQATNEDFGLVQGGVTYLARDEASLAAYEDWLAVARDEGLDTRILRRAEMAAHIPGATGDWAGALYTPSDMRAEPWSAVPALARLAVREGAVLLENCAARRLDISGGAVSGLVTEKGRIRAAQVLVAGGAWSSLFLAAHGVRIPQLSVRATVAAVDAKAMPYQGGAAEKDIAWRPRQDGGYSLAAGSFHELLIGPDALRHAPKYLQQLRNNPFGTKFRAWAPKGYPDGWGTPRRWEAEETSPFERVRVLHPKPNAHKTRALLRKFETLFPQAGPVVLKSAWAGMIDTLPDLVPVVDRAEAVPGLFVAAGMSGHGFGIGPGIGRVMADMMSGGEIGYNLSRFRLSRFTDGSPIELGPAI